MTQVVEEGTIVTVKGRFHTAPFEFEEMRAPHMEIPLASVKIANRAAECCVRPLHPTLPFGGAKRGDYHLGRAEPRQSRRRHPPAHPGVRAHAVSLVH